MLARSTKIVHKFSGATLETPILVPSFSSKGFARNHEGKSEIGTALKYSSEFITRTYLISAYDLYFEHIPNPVSLPQPEMIFLDSGGYEVSWSNDYSAVFQSPPYDETWDELMHKSVLEKWPEEIPAIMVSYDNPTHREEFANQIKRARKLFRAYPNQLHLFLLKPETKTQKSLTKVLKIAVANVEEFSPFDIVGVTEKELGNNTLDRMANIAILRRALDGAKLDLPIHVFGALDPITVCLYFIAGAEIFDGLTWIRYAYDQGRCIYLHNHGALQYGLHARDDQVKLRAMTDNIYSLETLEHKMREFVSTNDFKKLTPNEVFLEQARDSLMTKIKGEV